MKENLNYIDVAKTLSIFIVVYAHLTIPHNLHGFIAFRMALFFFVAGYLFPIVKQEFNSFIKKKTQRIIIPYFFFSFISFLFWLFILKKFNPASYPDINFLQYLFGIFYAAPDKDFILFNIPLWFLPCLFIIQIIYFFISMVKKRILEFLITILLFVLGIVLNSYLPFRPPWGLDVALCSVVFFMLGNWAREIKFFDYFIFTLAKTYQMLLLVFSFFLFIITAYLNSKDSYVVVYQLKLNNYFLYLINGVFGILFIFIVSNFIGSLHNKTIKKFFAFYGKNTLVILCTHLILIALIKGALTLMLGIRPDYFNDSFFRNIFLFLGTILLLIPTIIFCKRYLWFVLGLPKNTK